MKVAKVYFSRLDNGEYYISCDVDVLGLGRVTIDKCILEETMQAVETQVLEALRQKLKLELREENLDGR